MSDDTPPPPPADPVHETLVALQEEIRGRREQGRSSGIEHLVERRRRGCGYCGGIGRCDVCSAYEDGVLDGASPFATYPPLNGDDGP